MQAWQIEIPEDNLLRSELSYWYKWHEMCFILFDLFVDECELNWSLNNYNGYGGHSEDVRLGNNGEGSFTYINPRNGIILPVNFKYSQGQDPCQVINNLVRSLNWQCADEQTCRELAAYGSSGNTINVDVSMSGSMLASLYKEHCVYEKDYINGISSNDWRGFKNIVDGVVKPDCYVPEFVEGWIYIASEFLNEKNEDGGFFQTYSFKTLIFGIEFGIVDHRYNFNMVFSHEMGHTLDSYFSTRNINRELNAFRRTKRQWDINESGWFSIP